ncbi:hypothetical protein [Nitrosomonas sp. Nm34]|uniref:hypothetical protein n=1 Tax=Nitrosomonas sp. Nm34 TaxID=1881055 RepID=UPI0008E21099|nr:hypothetical protein [Nitrosomonas sp. Nm34]SFI96317.1 hypothetical protein SAMN05428978_10684 [Nitrosomonas sp. Nm34]
MAKRQFKQGNPSDDLPASLEAAIDGMSVVHRTSSEEDERVLLAFAGEFTASWYHEPEVTRDRIAKAWPGLTDAQLTRACRAVNGLIRARCREAAPARRHSTWASWRPIRGTEIFPNYMGGDYE